MERGAWKKKTTKMKVDMEATAVIRHVLYGAFERIGLIHHTRDILFCVSIDE